MKSRIDTRFTVNQSVEPYVSRAATGRRVVLRCLVVSLAAVSLSTVSPQSASAFQTQPVASDARSASLENPEPETPCGPLLRFRDRDGRARTTRFLKETARLSVDVPIEGLSRLEISTTVYTDQILQQIVTLWTGERFPSAVTLRKATAERDRTFAFDANGLTEQPLMCGIRAIASAHVPAGCRDALPNESIQPPAETSDQHGMPEKSFRILPPLREGLAEVPLSVAWPKFSGPVRFLLKRADGMLASVSVHWDGEAVTASASGLGRMRTQPLRTSRPQCVLFRVGDGLAVQLDGAGLGTTSSFSGELIAVEVRSEMEIDGLQPKVRYISGANRQKAFRQSLASIVSATGRRDSVLLDSGDEVFGSVTHLNRTMVGLSLSDRNVSLSGAWAVRFARPKPSELAPERLHGLVARIDLASVQSCSLTARPELFWLRGVIVAAEEGGLRVEHPLLAGELLIDWRLIRRITPLFRGTYHVLDPCPRHLGNGYRSNFWSVAPDGTELAFEFSLTEAETSRDCFVSCDVAELLPSGKDTLKATPLLDDVRAGFLATESILNGETLGTLNSLVSIHIPAANPQRVRIRLPNRLLKSGANEFRIRQNPARSDSTSFDDCEIRALGIEIQDAASGQQ